MQQSEKRTCLSPLHITTKPFNAVFTSKEVFSRVKKKIFTELTLTLLTKGTSLPAVRVKENNVSCF